MEPIELIILELKVSDFNISGKPIPESVVDRILEHHLLPIQRVIDYTCLKIYPSLKSGYRSYEWEIAHGRSGTSQHSYIADGKGATDITCDDFEDNVDTLLEGLISYTTYTRFAVYNGFIHADYKKTTNNQRQLFKSGADSKWKFVKIIE